jgi:GDP/UDP-N,N'-diacetylbacillosamine 2-epimerase (hydrolysing)
MSHLHFVATDEYKRRVLQLGESSDSVFVVGGLGIENILRLPLMSQAELESKLKLKFSKKNLLITFHPVTLEYGASASHMDELLEVLSGLKDTTLIFTMPNADNEGRFLFHKINNFCANHSNAKAFISLGQLRYLSCLRYVDAVVGNSSSGLLEVPSFQKGTINIGDRQRGRMRSESVIDCEPNSNSIKNALKKLYSQNFQKKLISSTNPYDYGSSSALIIKVLEEVSLDGVLKKKFYDLAE